MDARTALEVLSWIDGKYPSQTGRTIRPDLIALEQKWVSGPDTLEGIPQYYLDGKFTAIELQAIAKYATNPAEVCAARKLSERNGKKPDTTSPAGNPDSQLARVRRLVSLASSPGFPEKIEEYRTAATVGNDEGLMQLANMAADCVAMFRGRCLPSGEYVAGDGDVFVSMIFP